MLTTAEQEELAELRALAYGAGATGLDGAQTARLDQLESLRIRSSQEPSEEAFEQESGPVLPGDGAADAATVAEQDGLEGAGVEGPGAEGAGAEQPHPESDPSIPAPRSRRLRKMAPVIAIAAAALVVGTAVGVWLAPALPPIAAGAVDQERYPELGYPATDEDSLPGEGGFTDVIDPDTSRFIAFVDDTVVWLAIAEDRGGICLIALRSPDLWSAECGDSDVTIEVDGRSFHAYPANVESEGEVRLSPSVTMTEPEE